MKLTSRAGLVQYGFSIIANICAIISAAWLVWPSSAIKPLENGEVFPEVSPSEVATMVAVMDFGNMITPIPASYLINMVGRKLVIHCTAIVFIAASLLTIFAENMWYLYIARLLAGMGKGIAFGVVPVYLTEIAQINMRGTLGSLFITGVSVGSCYGYIIEAYLSYQSMNICNLAAAIFFLIVAWFLPETPFYLVMKGEEEAAEKSLAVLRSENVESSEVKAEIEQVKASIDSSGREMASFGDIAKTKSCRRALLIVVVTSLIQRLSGVSPILAYGTAILPPAGGGLRPELYMIIFSFILSGVNYIGAVLSETCGRKKLMIYSALLTGAVNFVFAGYFTANTYGVDLTKLTWIPYLCLLLYAVGWSLGLAIMPPFLPSELFPTNMKSYASSISSIILGLASFGVNKAFGEVYLKKGGIEAMFYFFGVSCIGFTIFCVYFIIETKGKTFQEVQIILQDVTGETRYEVEGKPSTINSLYS